MFSTGLLLLTKMLGNKMDVVGSDLKNLNNILNNL